MLGGVQIRWCGWAASILLLFIFVPNGCRHMGDRARLQRGVYHTVERHQTLWRICKTYGVDIEEVARINGIKDKAKIKVGERIFIPGATKVLKVDVYVEDITADGKGTDVSYDKVKLIWPVRGKVTATFSPEDRGGKKRHDGIDIAAEVGTFVHAAASGKVVYCDDKLRGYGNLIILEHEGGIFTIYAHNQENLVKEDMLVKRGDPIAKVGKTGNATGAHLHFEVRKGSRPLDPLLLLP